MYAEIVLKNITFTADAKLIEQARLRALERKASLNVVFREQLARYASPASAEEDYWRLMKRLSKVDAGRHFTRDEMNLQQPDGPPYFLDTRHKP